MVNKNALVLTVGGTPEPLIKVIKQINPDLIYFIPTSETKKLIEEILIKSNYLGKYEIEELNNGDDLGETFLKSKEVFNKLQNEGWNLNADYTGGTKSMVAGFILAAVGQDCDFTYVGSNSIKGRDKNGVGAVKTGFELIKEQINPFNNYALIEIMQGKEFFNKFQFEASIENFKLAYEKAQNENLKQLSQIYINIVRLYDTWDKFNNKIENKLLYEYLEEILTKINFNIHLKKYFENNEQEFYNQLNENLLFLKNKISRKDKKIFDNIDYYLPDLLNNSKRRISEGKYDDAMARLYRFIEFIGQIKLKNENIIDKNILKINKVFHINKKQVKETNPDAENYLIKNEPIQWFNNKKTLKIPLGRTYNLLKYFDKNFVIEYENNKNLKQIVQKRNNSILAHGIEPINKNITIDLYNELINFSSKNILNIEENMKQATFPKFNDVKL